MKKVTKLNQEANLKQESFLMSVKCDVLNWLESISFRESDKPVCHWKYSSSMKRPYGLISTAHAVMIMGMLDNLKELSHEQKMYIGKNLCSAQDSADGFFKDSLVTDKDFVSGQGHSIKDIWGQMTGAAAKALSLLGEKPKYKLPETFYIDGKCNDAVTEINGWNWENPWHVGERFLRSLIALERDNLDIVDKAFDFYETEVMSYSNGMPMKRGCYDPYVAAAGLFKILKAYKYYSRVYPLSEKAIDFVFELQKPSGEFANDMCLNWDCIWVLRELDHGLNGSYRRDEIIQASLNLSILLLKIYRKCDGAFSFFQKSSISVHHSINIGESSAISDTMGTTTALRCLFYTDEFLNVFDKNAYSRIRPATIL